MTELTVIPITDEKDISSYKSALHQIDPYNPYCRYELIDVETKGEDHKLQYFLLTAQGSSAVLMPFYLRKIELSGETTAYFDVSTPWGYMGPLVRPENIALLSIFWEKVDDWYNKNNVVTEFIRFNFQGNHQYYSGTVIHTLSNIRGRLLSEEELWNGFKRSVRKNYKTATRNQLVCHIYHRNIPDKQIRAYYSIWKGTMDRLDAAKSYYHSFEYFYNYIKSNEDCCALAIVENPEGTPISTELLLFNDDTMFSFLGGTDGAHFNLRPNDLLKIKAMQWAKEKGLKYYILGGGLSDGDTLYQYKKKFFPEEPEINFYTGRKIVNHRIYNELNCIVDGKSSEDSVNTDLSQGFFPKYRHTNTPS